MGNKRARVVVRKRTTVLAEQDACLGRPIRRSMAGTYLLWAILTLLTTSALSRRLPPAKVPPVTHDGVRYVASYGGGLGSVSSVEAWDTKTGAKLWSAPVYRYQVVIEEGWVYITKLELRKGTLVVTDERGRTYTVDPKTGQVMPPPTVPRVSPVTYDGIRYIAPNNNDVTAYIEAWDVETGASLWSVPVFENPVSDRGFPSVVESVFISQLVVRDGRLVVTDQKNRSFSVDLKTGEVHWSKATWGVLIGFIVLLAPLAGIGGWLLHRKLQHS